MFTRVNRKLLVCNASGVANQRANDEMVLETAINGRANAVVTYNVTDFPLAAKRFRISVLSPADLLKKVRSWARQRIH